MPKFEANHEAFQSVHWQTICKCEYAKSDYYAVAEETYLNQKTAFLDILANLRRSTSNQIEGAPARSTDGTVRKTLPRIQLTQFSGAYEDWPAFRDLFQSIVGKDSSLQYVERLHYLKTSLKGEAALLLRELATTAENYSRAWTMLIDYYENKHLLVRSCFTTFTSLPKMKGESVSDLRIFHGILHIMGSLESIGRPITDCNDLFVHLIVELLDTRSRREWKLNGMPSI